MRVLHSATEAFPYVKVGGLSDVLGALPSALGALGVDARLLLPGFPGVLTGVKPLVESRRFARGLPGSEHARLLCGVTDRGVPVYVVDAPELYARSADPYADFGDSHLGAAALARAAVEIARDGDGAGWLPELLHCHDWQTALAPAYVALGGPAIPTIMTLHNLAYQGHFAPELLASMWLPRDAYETGHVEFFGRVNLLKAGIVYASCITTVSPTYAREIRTPEGGFGLDGVLRERVADVRGILNGVDDAIWNPATSPHLAAPFDVSRLAQRPANKAALQKETGLDLDPHAPLFGVVSRLAAIKGLDLLAENIPHLMTLGAELVVIGRGDPAIERAFADACTRYPGRVAFLHAQDERLAHRTFAGSDFVVVPSRAEPCGLVQLYAMRYGAVPVVRYTGGLADTVRDVTTGDDATGFTFDLATGFALGDALSRAVTLYDRDPGRFDALQRAGMLRNFSWATSARAYLDVYRELVAS